MSHNLVGEKFSSGVKIAGVVLVTIGFVINRVDIMIVGLLLVVLALANFLALEAFELSNQIGNSRDQVKSEILAELRRTRDD